MTRATRLVWQMDSEEPRKDEKGGREGEGRDAPTSPAVPADCAGGRGRGHADQAPINLLYFHSVRRFVAAADPYR